MKANIAAILIVSMVSFGPAPALAHDCDEGGSAADGFGFVIATHDALSAATGTTVAGAVFAAGIASTPLGAVAIGLGVGIAIGAIIDKGLAAAVDSGHFPGLSPLQAMGSDNGGKTASTSTPTSTTSALSSNGSSSGDPHLTTFDGKYYSFHGEGIFTLVESVDSDDVSVQVQQTKLGRRCPAVAINTGVATTVGGKSLSLFSHNSPPSIGGIPLDESQLPLTFENGDTVSQPEPSVYRIEWANGDLLQVRGVRWSSSLTINYVPTDSRRGRLRGLLGNYDGDSSNDIVARDGTSYDEPLTVEQLNAFGESYRVETSKSRFDVNAEGFEFKRRPPLATWLKTDAERKAWAEEKCAERNIETPAVLKNCIVDVSCTLDERFADIAKETDLPESVLEVEPEPEEKPPEPDPFKMTAPGAIVQGMQYAVKWSAPNRRPGKVEIFDASGKVVASAKTGGEINPVLLDVPTTLGEYRVEYSHDDETTETSFTVEKPTATILAPDSAAGGYSFEVMWEGTPEKGDWIGFGPIYGMPRDYYSFQNFGGDRVQFRAPVTPGVYALWYATRPNSKVLAVKLITVTPGHAAVNAQKSAEIGETFNASIEGPFGGNDSVPIYPADSGQYVRHAWAGRSLTMTAPATEGDYEIRYLANTSAGHQPMAISPLKVGPFTGELSAPRSAIVGDPIEVSFSGVYRRGSHAQLIKQGADSEQSSKTSFNAENKATIKTTKLEPGMYNLNYRFKGENGDIIGTTRVIELKPAE